MQPHIGIHRHPDLASKPGEAAARTHFLPGPSVSHGAALFVDVGRASPRVFSDKHRGRECWQSSTFDWSHYLLVNDSTEEMGT